MARLPAGMTRKDLGFMFLSLSIVIALGVTVIYALDYAFTKALFSALITVIAAPFSVIGIITAESLFNSSL